MDGTDGTDGQIIYIDRNNNNLGITSHGRFDVGKMAPMCRKYVWRGTLRLTDYWPCIHKHLYRHLSCAQIPWPGT